MEKVSHLKLMTMGLLQTCSYVTEQMQTKVTIDINKFLEAFSIEVDGCRIHPPPWTRAPIGQTSTSVSSLGSTSHSEDMDTYGTDRQSETISWLDLRETRSLTMARLQPTTAEEYQRLRDAVTSDRGPLHRTVKGTKGICAKSTPSDSILITSLIQRPNGQLKTLIKQQMEMSQSSQKLYLTSSVDVSFYSSFPGIRLELMYI